MQLPFQSSIILDSFYTLINRFCMWKFEIKIFRNFKHLKMTSRTLFALRTFKLHFQFWDLISRVWNISDRLKFAPYMPNLLSIFLGLQSYRKLLKNTLILIFENNVIFRVRGECFAPFQLILLPFQSFYNSGFIFYAYRLIFKTKSRNKNFYKFQAF